MSNATYILGTLEYLMLEITVTTPGRTFDPSDWTAEVSLAVVGQPFLDKPASWVEAELETVGTTDYVKVLLGESPAPTAGTYRALVRLTQTSGGTEIPLLVAKGFVTVAEP